MTDCIVVGSGLIGMLTARELVQAGMRVTLLDRNQPGRESSWAGGGILSPLYPWNYPDAVNRLALWGQQRYAALCEELHEASGIDPQWTQTGLLISAVEDARALEAWRPQFGGQAEQVIAGQAETYEPGLGIGIENGVWLPHVAQVRNPRLVKSLRAALEHAGVEFHSDCPVEGWRTQGGRVSAVVTPAGEMSADSYLVTSGAWSGELLSSTGLSLPVEPVRGQMLLFKGPPGLVRTMTLHQNRYIIPRRDGRVLVGSTLERVGFDKHTTDEAYEELRAAACAILPALADLPVEKHWAGLRPGSPVGIPAIGPHPGLDNLFVNAGQFRNGVVLGPASAHLAADYLLQRKSEFDRQSYLPDTLAKN